MYLPRASILLLVSSGLLAQAPDAWEMLLGRQRFRSNLQSAYQFVTRGQEFGGGWRNELALTKLRASGELSFLQLNEAQAKALWLRQQWPTGESRWVILGPALDIVASDTLQPTAESLLQVLREAGWKPQSERREAFLREHPDNGEAWQDLFTESLKVAMISGEEAAVPPEKGEELKAPDPEVDQARFGEVDRALRGLVEVDGWEDYFEFQVGLDEGAKGFSQSPLLQPVTVKMRRGVEAALKARPGNGPLWSAWTELAGPGDSPEALLGSLEPTPRQPWPPLDAAEPLALAYRRNQDWVGLERLAEAAIVQALSPRVLQAMGEGSDRFQRMHQSLVVATWVPFRVEALLRLGRRQDALNALAECRMVSGRSWRRMQQAFGTSSLSGAIAKDASESDQRAILDIIKQPALKDAPLPAAPLPLRLALQGGPDWKGAFLQLQHDPVFDVWKPGRDLVWDPLNETEVGLFKDRGEGGAARWVLLRGPELLSSGGELPRAETLADLLRAQGGPPYLAELDAFIKSHPDQIEAREQRISEVTSRTQTPGLEKRLLADLMRTRASAAFPKDWKPDVELWSEAARKLLPQIEADVRRWPTHVPLLIWVTWAALHPSHPKPGSLLRNLAIWKNTAAERDPFRTGPGMALVHLISEWLQSHKDWEGLADWCQALWELGWRDALPGYLKPPPGLREAAPPMMRNRLDIPFQRILQPWAEALHNLGRTEQLRQLELELELLQPGLANRLNLSTSARPGRNGRTKE